MMGNDLVCKSKSVALSILNTMINHLSGGTQRSALIAVRNWLVENLPPGFDEETKEIIQKIFEGSEEQQKGRAWLEKEMRDPAYVGHGSDHHEFIHEPENGAELDCYYSAKYKKWIPIGYGWPLVLHKTDGTPGEEE
jgi:hypothetical protein